METFGIETDGCPICEGPAGDAKLKRVLVWEDRLWRLTMILCTEVPGFSYLEPKRHIPHVTDLDGERQGRSASSWLEGRASSAKRPGRISSASASSADASRESISISPRIRKTIR